jgi:hypothetical protein
MKTIATAVAIMASIYFAGSAFANGASNNCNGRGSCATTNNTVNNTTNNTTNKGGTGIGIGIGKANSYSKSKSKSSSRSSASVRSNNSNTNKQGQAQQQKARTGDNNLTISDNSKYEAAASSAGSINLTSSNDTCMGSTGVGGQGMSFGFSIGSTWTDENCVRRLDARELYMYGHKRAAKARLCMDDSIAESFRLAGDPCPQDGGRQAAAASLAADLKAPVYSTVSFTGETE